jgi:hypothetical protein
MLSLWKKLKKQKRGGCSQLEKNEQLMSPPPFEFVYVTRAWVGQAE